MAELSHLGPSPRQERRHRRFNLRYPVNVRFDFAGQARAVAAVSIDISVGGVLMEAESTIPLRCKVKFVMTVPENQTIGSVQLAGEGEVVRVQPLRSGAGFTVAVRCERLVSNISSESLRGRHFSSTAKSSLESRL